MRVKIRRILGKIRDFAVNFFRLFPVKNAILFESFPDFNDSVYWWCDYLEKRGIEKKYKLYWIVKDNTIKRAPNGWNTGIIYSNPKTIFEFIKKYYVIFTSKFIFDGCVFVNKKRKKQVRFCFWHGAPIKRLDGIFDAFKGYDGLEIQSEWFAPFYSEYNLDRTKFICFGLIRNDRLVSNVSFLRNNDFAKKDQRIIIWLPTYRQRSDHQSINSIAFDGSCFGLPVIKTLDDIVVINNALKIRNIVLVIKPHPSQDLSCFEIKELSNIKVLSNEILKSQNIQLYDVLGETDALLTDYSSVYFDYLLLDRPIGLTCDDIEVYRKKAGFSFDNYENNSYEENIKGTYIRNIKDFVTFLDIAVNGDISEDQKEAKIKYNKYTDFKSAERYYDYLKNKYNF